jgi:polyhydroxyalkanoate synthesis regulator phasin
MKPVEDAAYAMAALSATLVLLRALVKKGLLTRDEAVRLILDEAVSQAIQAEAHQQAGSDANRQCAEMLKLIAERL